MAVDDRPRVLAHHPGLDGVRAVAVLAVLVFHAEQTWLPGGFLGVSLFFTLSGYLIVNLLVSDRSFALAYRELCGVLRKSYLALVVEKVRVTQGRQARADSARNGNPDDQIPH